MGTATLAGATGFGSFVEVGLGDDPNNTLYANNSVTHTLYSLNASTGAAALTGSNGATAAIGGLADFGELTSVPEPATAALIGFGLAGLGWKRWRRTRAR